MPGSGRPPKPVPPQYLRGYCRCCHDLTVHADTGSCERCGGPLAKGYIFIEADDDVLLAGGVVPPGLAALSEGRQARTGQTARDFAERM